MYSKGAQEKWSFIEGKSRLATEETYDSGSGRLNLHGLH